MDATIKLSDFDASLYNSPWIFMENEYDAILEQLISQMELKTFSRHSILFFQGDTLPPLYVVKTGAVRYIISNEKGYEKHILVGGPNCILGSLPYLDGKPSLFTAAVAEEDSQLYLLDSSKALAVIENIPGLKEKLYDDACTIIRLVTGHLDSLSFCSAEERIYRVFCCLIREYCIVKGDHLQLTIPFTHRELADMILSNRVTVSEILRKWKSEGILKKVDGYYHILKPDFFNASDII